MILTIQNYITDLMEVSEVRELQGRTKNKIS